jgi:signal transduction histidine kinase
VRQLVLNLVLNAIQAAAAGPRRPGRVAVKTCATNGVLQLTVVDNGSGIAPGDEKKIFEPFYSRRAKGQGTGLGLFIAQTILRSLRGAIRVSSWTGEGASFTVEVPVHDGQGGHPDRG